MAVNTRSWSSFLTLRTFLSIPEYVTNLEDAIKLIKDYEINTTTSFTITYHTKNFGNPPIEIFFF